jgi:hypothetical protein
MIYIKKDEVNQIILTLTEVSNIPNPYYLFVFQNEMDKLSAPITFYTADSSAYPERFNQFLLDEPVDLELIKGQYTYQIYESHITPPTIANSTGGVIEEGRMVVSGPIVQSIYE